MGLHSTAVLFGDKVYQIIAMFSFLFVSFLAAAGLVNGQGPIFFVVSIFGAFLHICFQFSVMDLNDDRKAGGKQVLQSFQTINF